MQIAKSRVEVEPPAPQRETITWGAAGRPPITWWGDVRRRFLRHRPAVVSAVVLVIFALLALLAPYIAPYDPIEQFRREGRTATGQPLPPTARFWLGTDSVGRDMLSRILFGARISLAIGVAASSATVILAVLIGAGSGFAGGKTDFLLMRFVDMMMSVPTFFLMLLLVTALKPGPWVVILVISVFGWTYPARIFRAEMLSLKQRDFVLAARCVGLPGYRIFLRHLLPHLLSLVIVYLALSIPGVIFAEAGLSFLGLGVPPPAPSWGQMIQDGQKYYRAAPWLVLFPGLAIMLTVVCFNLLGAGLREAMDPARRGR